MRDVVQLPEPAYEFEAVELTGDEAWLSTEPQLNDLGSEAHRVHGNAEH